jgi:hypothetical protein
MRRQEGGKRHRDFVPDVPRREIFPEEMEGYGLQTTVGWVSKCVCEIPGVDITCWYTSRKRQGSLQPNEPLERRGTGSRELLSRAIICLIGEISDKCKLELK